MTRATYGERAACERCGRDIEFLGSRQWRDRAGNRECPPYRGKDGDIVTPREGLIHRPYRAESRISRDGW